MTLRTPKKEKGSKTAPPGGRRDVCNYITEDEMNVKVDKCEPKKVGKTNKNHEYSKKKNTDYHIHNCYLH